jgi:hypothetical protein
VRAIDAFAFTPLGERTFKGFSRPLPVFAAGEALDRAGARSRSGVAVLLVAAAIVASGPTPARAQDEPGLPTLSGLGLGWRSASGTFQLDLSGRLDLEGYFPGERPQWLIPETDPFPAGRLRLFTDVFAGDHVYGMVELRADRGEAPADAGVEVRLEQAFVRVALPLPGRFHVQAGKFALPVGSYPERHHTPDDPLIRPPIMYDHRTIVATAAVPAATAGFLNWKNEPPRRPVGAPIIWNVPYPWGAMLGAGAGRFDARVAWISIAPSSGPDTWGLDTDRFERGTFTAAATLVLTPELRVAGYFARGPFIESAPAGTLPAGSSVDEFDQRLIGGEAVFARGPVAARAELFVNRWDVPNVNGAVDDLSYSIESKVKLTAGLFAAARFGEIRFNDVDAGTASGPWDYDIRRFQLGAGYRLLRNTEIRAEYLLSRSDGDDPSDDLFSLQWWWEF